ncbi:hypothetical protein QBC35DRAFT_384137, partial [Podospora australis]
SEGVIITSGKSKKEERWHVIIVTKRAIGAAPLTPGHLPQIISFSWTEDNYPSDDDLQGAMVDAFKQKQEWMRETSLGLLTRALNAELEPSGKKVQTTGYKRGGYYEELRVTLRACNSVATFKQRPSGHLQFKETGVLFKARSRLLWMPHRIIEKVRIELKTCELEGKSEAFGFPLAFRLRKQAWDKDIRAYKDIFYKIWPETTAVVLFNDIYISLIPHIKGILELGGIQMEVVQQIKGGCYDDEGGDLLNWTTDEQGDLALADEAGHSGIYVTG